jgi:hypothetical protein
MKRLIAIGLAALVTFLLVAGSAEAQLETPRPSPKGTVTQKVGVMDVSVTYSRPGIKGRKIFGGLVPYGEVWRTGANEATTISFSDEVALEGHKISAGEYTLYTIPGKDVWTIIINTKPSWGTQYDEKEDVLRFKVKPERSPSPIETFTINIANISTSTANIELAWENTVVKFKMEFDVDAKLMAQIKEAMANPYSDVAQMYYRSADYYFTTNKDLNQALEWVDKSLEINGDAFWVWRLKSRIQAELKDYKSAITTAEIGMAKAEKAGNKQYVKFNKDAIAEWGKLK